MGCRLGQGQRKGRPDLRECERFHELAEQLAVAGDLIGRYAGHPHRAL